MSLDKILSDNAQKYPNKEAIIAVDPDSDAAETISYKKLEMLISTREGLKIDFTGILASRFRR